MTLRQFLTVVVVNGLVTWAALASCDERVDYARPALLYGSLAAGDLVSTEMALRRGATEANPYMRSNREAKKLGQVAVLVLIDSRLQKHKGARWAFRGFAVAVHGYAIHRNLQNARRAR